MPDGLGPRAAPFYGVGENGENHRAHAAVRDQSYVQKQLHATKDEKGSQICVALGTLLPLAALDNALPKHVEQGEGIRSRKGHPFLIQLIQLLHNHFNALALQKVPQIQVSHRDVLPIFLDVFLLSLCAKCNENARGILLHKVGFCSKRHAKLEHLAGVRPPSRPGGLGSAKVSEDLKNGTNHALFAELELQHRDLAELVQQLHERLKNLERCDVGDGEEGQVQAVCRQKFTGKHVDQRGQSPNGLPLEVLELVRRPSLQAHHALALFVLQIQEQAGNQLALLELFKENLVVLHALGDLNDHVPRQELELEILWLPSGRKGSDVLVARGNESLRCFGGVRFAKDFRLCGNEENGVEEV